VPADGIHVPVRVGGVPLRAKLLAEILAEDIPVGLVVEALGGIVDSDDVIEQRQIYRSIDSILRQIGIAFKKLGIPSRCTVQIVRFQERIAARIVGVLHIVLELMVNHSAGVAGAHGG